MPNKPISPEAAVARMAELCARSEQCEADIRQKLYRLGLSPASVQDCIERLVRGRFIDNARFARAFANDKVRFSSWGRNKIRLALIGKRIPSETIREALDSIDEADYLQALKRTIGAKVRSLDLRGPDARNERLKLFRFVLSRGFEPDFASSEIRKL